MLATLIHWTVMSIFAAIMITAARDIWRNLTRPLDRNHYLKD